MKKIVVVCALALGVLLGAGGTALAVGITGQPYITKVSGNAQEGFRIVRSDGQVSRVLPKASALRICTQGTWYFQHEPSRMERISCRSEVRTETYWMTQMRRALRHAD